MVIKHGHIKVNKRTHVAHEGSKIEAGGPEKQVIKFVWPYDQ